MSHMSIIKPSGENEDVLGGSHRFLGDVDYDDVADDGDGFCIISESVEIEGDDDPFNDEVEWGLASPVEPACLGYQSREHEGYDQRMHHA